MAKKLLKDTKSNNGKYHHGDYGFDDGVDPRDLIDQGGIAKKIEKKRKLFHDTWAGKIAEEHVRPVYVEVDDEGKRREEKSGEMVAIDHDHNSRGRSPMIPVPKNLVETDDLGAPVSKRKIKISFRKLVSRSRLGGKAKNV